MQWLSEKEVKEWYKNAFKTSVVPQVYFKKIKLKPDLNLFSEYLSQLTTKKSCDLWIAEAEGCPLVIFVPGLSEGLVLELDENHDCLNAPDSFEAECAGVQYRMIKDGCGERILVPNWCLSIYGVQKLMKKEFAYWRPELVADKNGWYVGWAFYQHMNDCSYPQRRRKWQAFFRIDRQEFVSAEECADSYNKFKFTLSSAPVELENMQITFVYPNVICFDFH